MKITELHAQFCSESLAIRNLRPKTIHSYRSSLKQFLKYSRIQYMNEIHHELLRGFLFDGRINKNWTPETFLYYFKAIKPFFKWCIKRGYMEKNPMDDIDLPRRERKLPKRISKEDAMKLLEYSFNMKYTYKFERYRNRAIIGTLIYTGMRAQEMLDLKIAEIDIPNGVIMVRCGKGAKDRVIPICSQLRYYLLEYLKDRKRLNRSTIYFFTSVRGDIPFTYSGLKRVVEKLKKRTKIKFSAHRLRHTFATLMLEGGCDLFSLQKMLGHSDIKTTTIYLSTTVHHLQEQIQKHPLG